MGKETTTEIKYPMATHYYPEKYSPFETPQKCQIQCKSLSGDAQAQAMLHSSVDFLLLEVFLG